MSSSFVIAHVPQSQRVTTPETAELPTTITPAASRVKVDPAQAKLYSVEVIAKWDPRLAQTLMDVDFSEVIATGGARLSLKDAYAALTSQDYLRFETIATGVDKANRAQKAGIAQAVWIGAALALGGTSMALFTDVPDIVQCMIDLCAVALGGGGMVGTVEAGSKSAEKIRRKMIPEKLAALSPAPPVDAVNSSNAATE